MASLVCVRGGAATAVYDDRWLPILEALGSVEIRRATDVEWDPTTREWVATHRETGREIARGRNRAEVIHAEVAWLEKGVCDESYGYGESGVSFPDRPCSCS